jgi:hypothetical protein
VDARPAILGDALGLLFPATGTAGAIVEGTLARRAVKGLRWQGFVVDARRSIRRMGAN